MIKVLGASGSLDYRQECISLLISKRIVIDAGSLLRQLGEDCNFIEHVFLTHAHFDHILDLPFLIETHFEKRTHELNIYGLKETIEMIKTHLFNGKIWPEFQNIPHPIKHTPLLNFVEIDIDQTLTIDDHAITAVEANHCSGACGYLVKSNDIGCLISGDTYLNPPIIERLNKDPSIKSLLIDVSFPNRMDTLAEASYHLTPKLLQTYLTGLIQPVTVFPYHLKPSCEAEVLEELNDKAQHPYIAKVLQSGDMLDVFKDTPKFSTNHKDFTQENAEQLKSLFHIAKALSAETNLGHLLEMIVEHVMQFSHADAGTLYRLSPNSKELEFTVVRNNSLDIKMGGTAEPISWDNLPLYLENGEPNIRMVAALCALNKEVVVVDNVYHNSQFNFEGTKKFDASTGYQSSCMLVVPLLDQNHDLLGVLQLINKQDRNGHPIPFDEADQQNAMALASQAAISLTNTLLIYELEVLFESVVSTISKALDEKNSITGNHVRHVSEISLIIANGLSEDTQFYPEVHYSEGDIQTIKLAAMLHDVGKIATPEVIMQKQTKLEQVYDRVNILIERVEILKRDNRIAYLEEVLGASDDDHKQAAEARYQQINKELERLPNFLKTANTGNEFMADKDVHHVEELSRINYVRDNQEVPFIDLEERQNLSIRAGTLNQAERNIINNHAQLTLEILSDLPFPKKYGRIVDIAANHHEKLDGSGYPRGLTAKDIALEDRILILADIYEALSAKDRPYKAPKPLSEITRILSSMANQGHIDKKLLRFFFESGTYKAYNSHLEENQLDEFELAIRDD